MSQTLHELTRPLGPRISTVRPFTALTPLASPQAGTGFVRTHGLAMLAAGLSIAVAVVWGFQSGYLPMAHLQASPQRAAPATVNACTDPSRGETPAKASSLRELHDSVLPEIRAGIPPQMSRPAVIQLPPDLSTVTILPPVRPQPNAVPASKPAAKNKPVPAPVRP